MHIKLHSLTGIGNRSIAAILFAIAPICLLFAFHVMRPGGATFNVILDGIESGAVHLEDGGRLELLARPFVVNTEFSDKINTVGPPKDGYLNLYSAETRRLGLPQLDCNCAYIGVATLVCDRVFLETFATAINFDNRSTPETVRLMTQVDETFENWLSAWLIGHEIGHAVLHADKFNLHPAIAGAEAAAHIEREADRFFAERVPIEMRKRATFALTSFAFQMISLTYRPSLQSADGRSVILGIEGHVHQPWLIRTLDVAQIIIEQEEGIGSGEAFFGGLRRRVRVSPDGIDIGTFCDRKSLRERVDAAMEQRKRMSSDAH